MWLLQQLWQIMEFLKLVLTIDRSLWSWPIRKKNQKSGKPFLVNRFFLIVWLTVYVVEAVLVNGWAVDTATTEDGVMIVSLALEAALTTLAPSGFNVGAVRVSMKSLRWRPLEDVAVDSDCWQNPEKKYDIGFNLHFRVVFLLKVSTYKNVY